MRKLHGLISQGTLDAALVDGVIENKFEDANFTVVKNGVLRGEPGNLVFCPALCFTAAGFNSPEVDIIIIHRALSITDEAGRAKAVCKVAVVSPRYGGRRNGIIHIVSPFVFCVRPVPHAGKEKYNRRSRIFDLRSCKFSACSCQSLFYTPKSR